MENDSTYVFGEIVWYYNNSTNDIIYGIDGVHNDSLYSIAAIKDGVLAHPEHINHYDLWFNYNNTLPNIKGLINLRESNKDLYSDKENSLNIKFNDLCEKNLCAGRISNDRTKILLISEDINVKKLKAVLSFFKKKDLINDSAIVYWNDEPKLTVGSLFPDNKENMMYLSSVHKAQLENEEKPIEESNIRETPEILKLVEDYKKGDKEAAEKLFHQYEKMIRGIVNKHYRYMGKPFIGSNDDSDELQEAYETFYNSILSYDPSKGKLSTYVYNNVSGHIMNELNPNRKPFDLIPTSPQSSSDVGPGGDESVYSPLDKAYNPENDTLSNYINKDFLKEVMDSSLNSKLNDIIKSYFFDNKTLQEIGDEQGITKERVRQLVESALQKLRNHPDMRNFNVESMKLDIIFNETGTTSSTNADTNDIGSTN